MSTHRIQRSNSDILIGPHIKSSSALSLPSMQTSSVQNPHPLYRMGKMIMASVDQNVVSAQESFPEFFESWLVEQNQHLQELISAASSSSSSSTSSSNENDPNPDGILQPLINKVVQHYEHYYRAKSRCVERDVLSMFSPSWWSPLEEAFVWVGGWRPTMAFHLLYSKSGLQLESQLEGLIQGLGVGNLADLSLGQLSQVDELQQRTIVKEKEISEKLAKLQETAADSSSVELSHIMTGILQDGDGSGSESRGRIEERVESMLASKEERLEGILKRADDLRLNTLKEILKILTPMQGVHFLIAAAELHLRFHDWGKKRDAEVLPCGSSSRNRTGSGEAE